MTVGNLVSADGSEAFPIVFYNGIHDKESSQHRANHIGQPCIGRRVKSSDESTRRNRSRDAHGCR